jgi:hypothetical protein
LRITLTVVSKPQTHLSIPFHVEEEDEFVDEVEDPFQCYLDWNSPPIYDIDVNDEALVEVSSLSYDQEVDQNWETYHMFDESPKSEVFQLGLEEINFVDFLMVEIFYQVFLIKILMLVSLSWRKI